MCNTSEMTLILDETQMTILGQILGVLNVKIKFCLN